MQLTQFYPPVAGGEERHVSALATELAHRGHESSVITQAVDGKQRLTYENGVAVYRVTSAAMRLPIYQESGRPHALPIPDPLTVRHINDIVRRERPDVLHGHNWFTNSAIGVARSSRIPLVMTLHDYSQVCATKRLMVDEGRVCDGPGLGKCVRCARLRYGTAGAAASVLGVAAVRPRRERTVARFVAVSSAVAAGNDLAGQEAGWEVVPNFIPAGLRVADPTDVRVDTPTAPIVYVGDLSRDKGVAVLLRAYALLAGPRPPLVLIGRNVDFAGYSWPAGVSALGLLSHTDVLEAVRNARLVVAPSVWADPCPTTVLEAMAAARPLVSTRVGGVTDMVDDDVSGLLVEPGDARALAVAMGRLCGDATLRAELGVAAWKAVEKFTDHEVVGRLETVYREVCQRRLAGVG